MKHKIISILFTLLIPLLFLPHKVTPSNTYKFESYSKRQGLAHTHALYTFKDSRGFLWVSTYGGLQVYNSSSFNTFEWGIEDSSAVSHNVTNIIFEDRNGFLWFGTDNGLNKYNSKTGIFTKYFPDNSKPSISHQTIKTIHQDSIGNFWIGTSGGGLNYFIPKENRFIVYNSETLDLANDEFNYISSLVPCENGYLWIGTEKGGVFIFDSNSGNIIEQIRNFNPYNSEGVAITHMFKDTKNDIWIGTWNNGLYLYNKSNEKLTKQNLTKNSEALLNIRSIAEDEEGNLWLAHYGEGLSKFNKSTKKVITYQYNHNNPTSISNNFIWNVFIDSDQILWAGTFGGGLNKLDLKQYTIPLYQIPEHKYTANSNNGISAILEDHSGEIWLGTLGTKLYRYNIKTNTYIPFELNIKDSKPIRCIFEDFENQLWIGTEFGLLKIDSARNKVVSFTQNTNKNGTISSNPINDIHQDNKGNIWIASNKSGLEMLPYKDHKNKLPEKCRFIKYKHNDADSTSISSNTVNCIAGDKNNNLWIGTDSNLEKFELQTSKFTKLLSLSVGSIDIDKYGDIWLGTYGNGFYKLDSNGVIKEKYLNIDNIGQKNHTNSTILGMLSDSYENIWLTTDNGISKYNKKTQQFKNFSLFDELRQNYLWVNSIEKTSNGAILIGGVDGFNVLWPDSLKHSKKENPIVFVDFKVNNQSIVTNKGKKNKTRIIVPPNNVKELELTHKDKLLHIEFISLEFSSTQNIKYAYKLDGFDTDWIYTGSNMRFATYSNLLAGEYTFNVKASNKNGEWNSNLLQLSVKVSPPYWKTLWFRASILFILLAAVILFNRIRLISLKKQKNILQQLVQEQTSKIIRITEEAKEANEQKLRFFTNISHEFRTPLTLILGPIEHLKEIYATNDDHKQYFSIIQKNAFRLLKLINEILDLRRIDTKNMKLVCSHGNIISFTNEIIEAFKTSADKKGIQLIFNSNIQSFSLWFDPDKLEIILYNLISNAIRHTPEKGKIKVSLEIKENKKHYYLRVKNDGINIDNVDINRIFDRFYQLEISSQSKTKGSGIGLSLIKEIVDIHRGKIKVQSEKNEGTLFEIKLPIEDHTSIKNSSDITLKKDSNIEPNYNLLSIYSHLSIDQEIVEETDTIDASEELSKKALIIDDDDDLRSYVKTCLNKSYIISEASNGKEGLVKAKEIQPDVIISDIMMPIMDGIEFCNNVKSNLYTSHIPVILLSAKSSIEMQVEGFETGADAFIPKPFNKKFLITRVNAIVNEREKLRRNFLNKFSIEPNTITVKSVDENFIEQVKQLVEKNIDNSEFGVQELVDTMGISRSLIYTKFKTLTNCTTAEFIKTMRLKRACQLLKQKTHRVSEIAYMVGFNDPQSFSKTFKKQYGISPSQYSDDQELK